MPLMGASIFAMADSRMGAILAEARDFAYARRLFIEYQLQRA